MDSIMFLEGNVDYKLTLDAGVWIFDDQKVDMLTYFDAPKIMEDEQSKLDDYTKKISHYWDREIQEGAVFPKTLKTEKKFIKEKLITGTFGIAFRRFLMNASPKKDATQLIIETDYDSYTITLEEGYDAILAFSKVGQPLRDDGPVHFYFGNGSNKENPIKYVKRFIVK
jgi:hypothetical protein